MEAGSLRVAAMAIRWKGRERVKCGCSGVGMGEKGIGKDIVVPL